MTKKKAALIGMFLLVSLAMAAHQSPQFQAQTTPNPAAFLMVVSTPARLPSQTPGSILSPVAGAQQWLKALNTQDDNQIQNLTCQAQQENLKESSGWVLAFPVLAKLPSDLTLQIQVIGSALKFDIIRQNEGQARVRVYGNLPVTGPGLLAVYEVDERWWMVNEDGVWQWCGTSPGEATPTLTPTITATPLPITRSVRAGSSSSPTWWQILSVFVALLGAVAKIYTLIQRNRDKTG